ncbi:MAG TPA: cation diffusion facilitator family transporter [Candidatus Binataceae bacterium]|nr:cation diffusion facilitator family transporter [Candidatus Binataceae bacterium]
MGHHSHSHRTGTVLIVSLILTCAFVIGETIAGVRAHSLALLSDAGHNFTDAIALALAGVGYFWQSRPGNQSKTFGYHRMGVLAAFVNALLLAALAMALFYESYRRLIHPEPVTESVMIWVAAIGLVLNLAIAWSLDGNHGDLNLRAAWVHMLGDAASCVGIIAGAILIYFTGWLAIDPLLSILIGAAIIWTAWDIFKDSINILLEGLPKGLKLSEVTRAIRQVTGVIDVHDLHIWSLGSEAHALSCHVLIEDMPPSESDSILRSVNRVLGGIFHIHHTTIQFEHVRCVLADGSCTVGKHSH